MLAKDGQLGKGQEFSCHVTYRPLQSNQSINPSAFSTMSTTSVLITMQLKALHAGMSRLAVPYVNLKYRFSFEVLKPQVFILLY
jgi:hypothetical protein